MKKKILILTVLMAVVLGGAAFATEMNMYNFVLGSYAHTSDSENYDPFADGNNALGGFNVTTFNGSFIGLYNSLTTTFWVGQFTEDDVLFFSDYDLEVPMMLYIDDTFGLAVNLDLGLFGANLGAGLHTKFALEENTTTGDLDMSFLVGAGAQFDLYARLGPLMFTMMLNTSIDQYGIQPGMDDFIELPVPLYTTYAGIGFGFRT